MIPRHVRPGKSASSQLAPLFSHGAGVTAAIAPHVSAGTRRSRGLPRPRPAGLYVARPWPAEHDRLYCLLARHTPKRLASATSGRPEGQPVNHSVELLAATCE